MATTFLYAGPNTTGMSRMNVETALAMSAESVGARAAPTTVNADSALRRAYSWWQRGRWHYLQVKASGIVVAANATEITLPSYAPSPLAHTLRSIYELKVGLTSPATQRLDPYPESLIQRQLDGGGTLGGTYYYSLFGTPANNKIQIHDAWGTTAGVADIWASRLVYLPTDQATLLDVPEGPAENAILSMAGYYIALFQKAPRTTIDHLKSDAVAFYREARGMDREVFGQMLGFLPAQIWNAHRGAQLRDCRQSPHAFYRGQF